MKFLIVLALVATLAFARPEEDGYDSKLDDLDVDSLVTNERLLKAYSQCFQDKGSCTPEGKAIKKIMPEVIETNCKKCSAKQRSMIRKMVIAYKDTLPDEWEALVKTFDPEKKHKEDLEKLLAETD